MSLCVIEGCWSTLITPARLLLPVCAAAGRLGLAVPGPGPPLPPLLLLLAVLSPAQERGVVARQPFAQPAAQRRLLLHGLVCHHRHARVQVSGLNPPPLPPSS